MLLDYLLFGLALLNLAGLIGLGVFIYVKNRPQKSLPFTSPSPLRFGFVRFNPFSDTGGEQSFVVSLLDRGGNGILLTSLNGRGVSRIYAKRIIDGKSDVELSAEEKQAISQALNQKINYL